ncbi:hypothetical protein XaFJ1_GM001829 [Xanthomonas albilineans]|nr:hypothetical protein XaFJ1_GM001829 [Xanthomonas albilineans]
MDTSMPPNLLHHLWNVAELMPYSRHSSGTGVPASAYLSTAMIWLSVKRDFFMKPSRESVRESSIHGVG